jgi:hypothetical protein
MGMGANLLRAGVKLSARLGDLMDDPGWRPTPNQAVGLLRSVAAVNSLAIEMATHADDMERRVLGQPDIVVEHTDMTPQSAVSTLAAGARTMQRLRRLAARGDLPDTIPAAAVAAHTDTAIVDTDTYEDDDEAVDDEVVEDGDAELVGAAE